MNNEALVSTVQFCAYHKIELAFIDSLSAHGLIKTVSVEETQYIPAGELYELEKIVRLHYELDINLEGIEAISHLLQRMDVLQKEIAQLRNELDFYRK